MKIFFDDWNKDSLRLRILKQFIKYGDYLRAAGFGSRQTIRDYAKKITSKNNIKDDKVSESIDDNIFDLLNNSSKEDRKLGLLRVADDLALGNFRAGGASKRALYLFAMSFKMTAPI